MKELFQCGTCCSAEELPQRPNLNPTENLWDELERKLRARPITQHQRLTTPMSSCVLMRAHSHSHVPTSNGKSCQNSGNGKGGPNPYYGFEKSNVHGGF